MTECLVVSNKCSIYYTGKHHLDDDLVFLWLLAGMPVLIMSVIWGINEVWAWLERRKKKPKQRA